jgi:hypothetical protein
MIDKLFQTVQAEMDKEQMDYLRPMYFNLYLNASLLEVFNKLLSDVKVHTRRSNFMLDGKNLADFSENIKQFLEHYLTYSENDISRESGGYFNLPSNLSFIKDVIVSDTVFAEKTDLEDFNLLKRNTYSPPTKSCPICTKIGTTILLEPTTIDTINLYYLRTPTRSNWTFEDVDGKPMFDSSKSDFKDIDAPELLFDELLRAILKKAGVSTRDATLIQAVSQDEGRDIQIENRQ